MTDEEDGSTSGGVTCLKELRDNQYSAEYILGLTSELIGLVTKDLRDALASAVAGNTSSEEVRTKA